LQSSQPWLSESIVTQSRESIHVRALIAGDRSSALHAGCSGAGTRGNGVPTPFSHFALK